MFVLLAKVNCWFTCANNGIVARTTEIFLMYTITFVLVNSYQTSDFDVYNI